MMDVESVQRSSVRRLRCLDVCLVASVVFLFAALAAVAVVTVGVGRLVSGPQPPCFRRDERDATRSQPQTSEGFKMQNFVYVEATKNALGNRTMEWNSVAYGEGESVGSLFVFHEVQHSVEVTQDGYYFLYVDLKLTCTGVCDTTGSLTVRVGNHLNCSMELPTAVDGSTPLSLKCWNVARMEAATRLVTQMTVSEKAADKWSLDVAKSGQGIFLME